MQSKVELLRTRIYSKYFECNTSSPIKEDVRHDVSCSRRETPCFSNVDTDINSHSMDEI
jgi:hypothetical protein